ncbi:MAG TPA: hypothetical protein PLT87_01950 [Spirochaetales bacterium]|nr:hypothetical protein [Spirochaetales bacterium]
MHKEKSKKIARPKWLAGFALILIAVQLFGCSFFQKKGETKLSIKLQLEPSLAAALQVGGTKTLQKKDGQSNSKSIMPSDEWKIAKYTIDGLNTDGSTISLTSIDGNANVDLKPGEWTFSLKAFTAAGLEVASSTQTVKLQPSRSATITATLLPIQGEGSLQLTITSGYQLGATDSINGALVYLGLPGYPKPASTSQIPITVTSAQNIYTSSSIPAGYYELNLKITDEYGNSVAGLADVVLVLTGLQTKGTCNVEVGNSGTTFSPQTVDVRLLPPLITSVKHMLSYNALISPLALPPDGNDFADLESCWFANGSDDGNSLTLVDPCRFPNNALFYPPIYTSPGISQIRMDVVARSASSGRIATGDTLLNFINGPEGTWSRWVSGYNYKAATGQSLFRKGIEGNTGTGTKATVRGLACSKQGLVAVTGMDYDSAIHTFMTSSGVRIQSDGLGVFLTPVSSSWVRLWRDQFKIDSSAKNADVVAVSTDGLHIAATQAGSTSGWLRIYNLNPAGDIVSTFTTSPATGGPSNLRELKALRFSNDGSRLYAVSGQTKSLFSYVYDGSTWSLRSIVSLTDVGSSSQNVKGLEVTPSDAIVISSAETSKLFVFRDDGSGNLSLDHTITPNTSGYVLKAPSALTSSAQYDGFYVVNDAKEILLYIRSESSRPYTLLTGIPLEASLVGAKSISVYDLQRGDREEVLCVVGGSNVGLYKINTLWGTVVDQDLIHPDALDLSGLANADTVCNDGKSFFIGGGSSGIVSVIEVP